MPSSENMYLVTSAHQRNRTTPLREVSRVGCVSSTVMSYHKTLSDRLKTFLFDTDT